MTSVDGRSHCHHAHRLDPVPAAPAALTFTGERFTPEVRGAIWYEHWHRYASSRRSSRGRRVLDAACGEGYGSFLLARTAAQRDRRRHRAPTRSRTRAHRYARAEPRVRRRARSPQLPLADASVDVVVSFETIEHLAAAARDARRVPPRARPRRACWSSRRPTVPSTTRPARSRISSTCGSSTARS